MYRGRIAPNLKNLKNTRAPDGANNRAPDGANKGKKFFSNLDCSLYMFSIDFDFQGSSLIPESEIPRKAPPISFYPASPSLGLKNEFFLAEYGSLLFWNGK